jgi:hypothetical protein
MEWTIYSKPGHGRSEMNFQWLAAKSGGPNAWLDGLELPAADPDCRPPWTRSPRYAYRSLPYIPVRCNRVGLTGWHG